jgi:hypothetical protein
MKTRSKKISDVIYSLTMAAIMMFMLACLMMLFQSCAHDPIVDPSDPDNPGGPGTIDTTENPIDTSSNGVPCDPSIVYFNTEVLPILLSNCAKSGCHDAITHQEGIILDSYENVMNSEEDVVDPFDLDDSDMYEVITEDDSDKRMPPPPNQRLTADQISTIRQWIQQGAQNLTCDENTGACETENISYSGFVAPLLTNTCVGCHSGGSPSGGITLNTHAGVQAVALNGRLFGAISHASGFQPMPRGGNKLSQCTIDKIKGWIDDGAPNN